MLLFLSLTGILLSLILIYFNARIFPSSIYLGGFFFLVGLYGFILYAVFYSQSLFLIALVMGNFTFLTYLIGPMLYWYIRSIFTDQPRLSTRDLWHFLPMVVFLISTIPYLISPWSEKIANAELLIHNIVNLKAINISLLYDIMPPPFIFLSRPVLILIYIGWSGALFVQWIRRKKNQVVLVQQRYMFQWLVLLLVFSFILVTSHLTAIIMAYLNHDPGLFFTLTSLQLFSGIGLAGLLISPLFFPAILYGLPRIPDVSGSNSRVKSPATLPQVGQDHPNKPEFETEYLVRLGEKIDHCMEALKPYLQSGCNLAYISKLTGIPTHHLAYYFREVKQQPFTDFRNAWRIQHAKRLLEEGKAKELTLEAIGLLSGFSTRNTFYTSFKKVEGISPRTYILDKKK